MSAVAAAPALHSQGDPRSVRSLLCDPRQLHTEVLAGLVVALALIPKEISFSILSGAYPAIGLFAPFTMAVTIAVVGGRPAMISAATGALALVVTPAVHEHGLPYLIATVLLAAAIHIVLALLGVARLIRFIPRSVMTGFVNALAILIFTAQLPQILGPDISWTVYPLVTAGIALLLLPEVPCTLETLRIIAPYALAMALVAVMIMVSVGTFDWHSIRPATLRAMPWPRSTPSMARPAGSSGSTARARGAWSG